MLYQLTKPVAKIAFQVYFRKLYLSHLENVPLDKPVVLATNHPTAFIEPCIMACWLPKPLSFLARGDLYLENPFIRKLYDWYHLIPVFRIVDAGYSNVKNNYHSFDRCLDALSKKRMVMILAEGRVKHEKRLRPVVKGTARIVFSMLGKYGDQDVHVIPVGVTYSNPDEFRSIAMLDFGPPIKATEYTERYRENPARAITELTQELAVRIRSRMVHIERIEDEDLVEHLLELSRNDFPEAPLPVVEHTDAPLRREIAIAEGINRMTGPDKDALRQRVDQYFKLLKQHHVTDFGLLNRGFYKPSTTLLVLLGWLPFAVGYALNYLPLKAGRLLAERLAPSIEFIASMAGVFASLFWMIYVAVIAVVLGTTTGSWWSAALVLVIPFLGLYALVFMNFFGKWKQARAAASLPEGDFKRILRKRPFFQP
ncbi:MAG: hypothetical protein Kow0027_07330 [Saprospiraceae bacterium]